MSSIFTEKDFLPYLKMDNIRMAIPSDLTGEIVAWEKIHGANIQIGFNADSHWIGSRTKKLSTQRDLKNFNKVDEVITDELMYALNDLRDELLYEMGFIDARHHTVIFFGELYGANIQKDVCYSDKKHIAFFDIVVDGNPISLRTLLSKTKKFNIPTPPVVATGTFAELRETLDPNKFDSLVPSALHGSEKPSISEGFIIRLMDDDSWFNRYKWKSDKFSERPKPKVKGIMNSNDPDVVTCAGWMNQNRFDAFKSKHPVTDIINTKNMRLNINALVQDVLCDVKEEYPLLHTNDKRRKALVKIISKTASELLRTFIKEYDATL